MQGVVKTYDPVTRMGIVVRDDGGDDVFLGPDSLEKSIFETLRQGQRIVFDLAEAEGRSFAANVRVGSDGY